MQTRTLRGNQFAVKIIKYSPQTVAGCWPPSAKGKAFLRQHAARIPNSSIDACGVLMKTTWRKKAFSDGIAVIDRAGAIEKESYLTY